MMLLLAGYWLWGLSRLTAREKIRAPCFGTRRICHPTIPAPAGRLDDRLVSFVRRLPCASTQPKPPRLPVNLCSLLIVHRVCHVLD